ncbi:MAG: B12-binding domain-containing radical SAM protein [Candidatus Omnitrophica bacterium]|nr:B12-binding domain-containing radical SAM protein [Candidatus Omnitrophota bacterium]
MRKKLLFVRCPKYMWPWVNESDNFLLPLGLPALAASLRVNIKDLEVKIIDCAPLKIGWERLAQMVKEENPDFIGAGEEALYHHEAVKLFQIAKGYNKHVVTIAGGHYFSWMVEKSLREYSVDIIVRFEGEETIVSLMDALLNNRDLSTVEGIAFKRGEQIVKTSLRPYIKNLDDLPVPAFDLMPMMDYAKKGIFWPVSATIEGSRGCIDTCSYCALWTYWGNQKKHDIENGELEVTPFYRQKSVARVMEEVDILCRKYKRRLLLWADPTFNVNPKWTNELCDEILKREYKVEHWVFLRADFALRDAKLGVLDKMVRAGFVHPLFGVERSCAQEWTQLKKHNYKKDSVREVFHILRDKHPEVFRQATFVTSFPFDTEKSMMNLAKYAIDIDCDFPVFHPITPTPGTYLYEDMVKENYLEEKDLKEAYWEYPLLKNDNGLTRKKMAEINRKIQIISIFCNPKTLLKGIFSPYAGKRFRYREVLRTLFLKVMAIISLIFKEKVLRRKNKGPIPRSLFFILEKPEWYDS